MEPVILKKCTLALCALIASAFVWSAPAQAQVGPCPYGGPSPGYRVVGQTPAGNGVGSIFLCEPTNEGQPQQPRQEAPPPRQRIPTYATPSYFAFAYHQDSKHVWSASIFPTEEEAKNIVMANCTKIMGAGCAIGYSGTNTSMTIFEVSDGSLMWVRSDNPGDTQKI